jgi:hypothetical protein
MLDKVLNATVNDKKMAGSLAKLYILLITKKAVPAQPQLLTQLSSKVIDELMYIILCAPEDMLPKA